MYSTAWCPYCARARNLLKRKGVAVEEIDIDGGASLRDEMIARSGRRTVPQIFIDSQHVGGCDDLFAIEESGKLDAMLAAGN